MTLEELKDVIAKLDAEIDIYQHGTRTKAGSKRIRKYLTQIRKNAPAIKRELIIEDRRM
jgi:predicted SnoaL-like aldol condensation-catalyzing enzyme